jgi:uroporphyrinogen decarboxylase
MDSQERVARVLQGEVPDRVPVALHSYLLNCQLHGGRFDEILRSGEAMAEAQLAGWRTFGHDVLMLEIGVCAEAEALGASIRYTADGPPHVAEPLIKEPDDLDRLRIPDPERAFPLTEMLKATRIVKGETGGRAHINGRSDQGPIALANALMGPERFLTMLMDAEWHDWCRRLLSFCSQVNVALGEAQRRAGPIARASGWPERASSRQNCSTRSSCPVPARFARPCGVAAPLPSSTPAATRRTCWKTSSPPAPTAWS